MGGVMRIAVFVLVLAGFALPASAQSFKTRPNPSLTQGKVREDLTIEEICRTKWGSDARAVTARMKQDVYDAYEFNIKTCPLTTLKGKKIRRAEIDHLVPRSLGGADDVANLWPECYEPVNSNKSKQADGAHK